MKKLQKAFLSCPMTWGRVLLFAVIAAVYTGLIMVPKALANTSFQDIGTYPDPWLVFAVFIVMNCKKPLDAAVKCFVFFLVSQPLIYLIQVPFTLLGWGIFMYYKRWFIATLFTFPAAIIAFMVKKKSWFSAVILSGATAVLGCMGAIYLRWCLNAFPHHLLSVLFDFGFALFFSFALTEDKKKRLLPLAATALGILAAIILG